MFLSLNETRGDLRTHQNHRARVCTCVFLQINPFVLRDTGVRALMHMHENKQGLHCASFDGCSVKKVGGRWKLLRGRRGRVFGDEVLCFECTIYFYVHTGQILVFSFFCAGGLIALNFGHGSDQQQNC